eukprot:6156269-Alexandrium_andersonii.AAC.1
MARWRRGRSALGASEWPAAPQDVVWHLPSGARDALAAWAEQRAAAPVAAPSAQAAGDDRAPAPPGGPGEGDAEAATPTGHGGAFA